MSDSRSLRPSLPRVSYAESSDDTSSQDGEFHDHSRDSPPSKPIPTRSSKRKRTEAPKPSPRQPSTLHALTERPKPRARRVRRRLDYAEPSSGDEDTDPEDVIELARADDARIIPSIPRHKSRRRLRTGQTTSKRADRLRGTAKQHLIPKAPVRTIESDGVQPDWTSLPYEILLSIFKYAMHPLHEDYSSGLGPTANVTWAVHAARICKAFSEPALTALYECPPVYFQGQTFGLLDLLRCRAPLVIDYRSKIKRLHLDSKNTLAYATAHRGKFPLAELLKELTQLQCVNIVSYLNAPPFFCHSNHGSWSYPVDIFPAMSDAGIRLKSWRWCGDKMVSLEAQDMLDRTAGEPCLQHVKHLTLSRLTFVKDTESLPPAKRIPAVLPDALVGLSELRSLMLETCDVLSWDLLNRLPNPLEHLSIINCPDLDPKTLRNFLAEHGRDLKTLDVSHNNLIDLSFLPDLRNTCPQLEALKMDALFYSTALMFKSADAEPRYETLLVPGHVPTWPRALREIEFTSLRKWSPDAAAVFFQSLIDSAGELPHLRYLTVRAMLDIGWRDRAGFREKYIGRLETVFLRQAQPPSLHLESHKAYRLWKAKRQSRLSDVVVSVTHNRPESVDEDMVIQGLCEKVDINIDNMRPTEHQFREDDFMDSEVSGDEDWNGTDQDAGSPPTRYAW